MSLVWTIGATLEEKSRKIFSNYLIKLLKDPIKLENKSQFIKMQKGASIPERNNYLIYDYFIDPKSKKWVLWEENLEDKSQKRGKFKSFHEILVQTPEFMQTNLLLNISVKNEYCLLLSGVSGSAKTLYINSFLKSLDKDLYITIPLGFSAKTTPAKTKQILLSSLEKRRKGIFGPLLSMRAVVFVDEMNMPSFDTYGAQPAIELLRQLIHNSGFHTDTDRKFVEIVETQFIAAMGSVKGNRQIVSPRLLRLFHLVNLPNPSNKTMHWIFEDIMKWFLHTKGY